MKHTTICTLTLEDKTFTDKTSGQFIDYVEASVIIDGEKLFVKFRKEDKSLLRVLRRTMDVCENGDAD